MGAAGRVKVEMVSVPSTGGPALSDSSDAIFRISVIFKAILSEAEGSSCATESGLLGGDGVWEIGDEDENDTIK